MKISHISVYTCKQRLKIPFRHASSGLIEFLDGVYVKVETDAGFEGFGEVRGNCSYFTGDTTDAVVSVIANEIAPKLIGKDPEDIAELNRLVDSSIVRNMAAKSACNCALYDLLGKIRGVPVYRLLGEKIHTTLNSEENIPFMPVQEAEAMAQHVIDNGCRFIKMRVGAKDFQYDLDRVSAVWQIIGRNALQNEIVFSMDANRGWETDQAIRCINALSQFGITIVEQPIHFSSINQMRKLKENCPVKIFGDEDVGTIEELQRYAELGLIDGIHIKLIKCGGIANAMQLVRICKEFGISYMIGGMDEGMMAVAAAVQCAAVCDTNFFEVHGHMRIQEDPTTGLEVIGSIVTVPASPGLGVTIDETKLKKSFEI